MSRKRPAPKSDRPPAADPIAAAIGECLRLAIPWSGTVFRYASPEYASPGEFLSGNGGLKADGRWHVRGVRVIYASLDPETAQREALAKARYYGWPTEAALPLVFGAARVKLRTVLDLTGRSPALRVLGLTRGSICDPDWREIRDRGEIAATQGVGLAARDAGFEGLLVPSAAAGAARTRGMNLVYFPDRLSDPPGIINAEKMPGVPGRK